MSATEPKPAPAPLDPKDYEIACLKLRNEQMHRRIAILELEVAEARQRRRERMDPWIAGEGEV